MLFALLSWSVLTAQESTLRQPLLRWYHRGDCDSFLLAAEQYQQKGEIALTDLYEERFECYERTYRFADAIRWLEKIVRKHPDAHYLIDLAYLYKKNGQEKKAARLLRKTLKKKPASVAMARYVGHRLVTRGFLDAALSLYQQAGRALGAPFCQEIGTIYYQQQQWEKSWEAWFRCAEKDQVIRQQWQAFIQDHMIPHPPQIKALKQFLIRKAQHGSESAEELLAWLYMQEGNYPAAFRHLKALDLRLGERGRRILPLAEAAREEGQKDVARKAYEYILHQQTLSPYYPRAYSGWLRLMYETLAVPGAPRDSVRWLTDKLEDVLNDPLYRQDRIEFARMWARLRGIRLGNPQAVLRFFDEQLQYGGLSPIEKGEWMLLKGDVEVRSGRLWQAWLTYSRVEKTHKGDLTDRARLRKAWLAFYMGNFDHAILYTDVLKGGTDKYVANDAMALELLIKDHRDLAPDTTTTLLRHFAQAHLAYRQEDYHRVFQLADTILRLFPPEGMKAALLYLQGQAFEAQHLFDSALQAYATLFGTYPDHILTDDALYRAARIYDREKHQPRKALRLYEKLIFNHPGSVFTAEIRKRYRALRKRYPTDRSG